MKNILGFNQRQIARQMNFTGKSIREPVPPEKRRGALIKAKNKCQWVGCNTKESGLIKLEIHHKNQRNDDNRLSNLQVLCRTHHGAIHRKYKRIYKKDILGIRRTGQRIVLREKLKRKKTAKKTTRKSNNLLGIPEFRI